jgi:hypothetical protein
VPLVPGPRPRPLVGRTGTHRAPCFLPSVVAVDLSELQGGGAICSREWLAAPPYVLLPQQQ